MTNTYKRGRGRAKTKDALHYRLATAADKKDGKCCRECKHIETVEIFYLDGTKNKDDFRCKPIGFGNSIRYAVREDCVCDRFEYFSKKA